MPALNHEDLTKTYFCDTAISNVREKDVNLQPLQPDSERKTYWNFMSSTSKPISQK